MFEYTSWGGWGELTFGLLKPSQGDHSYGVLGQGNPIGTSVTSEVDKAWHRLDSFREASTSQSKYLIWSVFPKDLSWGGQTAESTSLNIELGSYSWSSVID